MLYHAAKVLDSDNPSKIISCSMAKLYSTDNCLDVAN